MSDEEEAATAETAEADVEAEATALATPWAAIPKDETSKHEFILLLVRREVTLVMEGSKSHVYYSY